MCLLTWKSRTVKKCNHLKWTVQRHLEHSQSCVTTTSIKCQSVLIIPERTRFICPSPAHDHSPWIYLLWTLCVNSDTQIHVVCAGPSTGLWFSGSSLWHASVLASFCDWMKHHRMVRLQFVVPLVGGRLVSAFGGSELYCCAHSYAIIWVPIFRSFRCTARNVEFFGHVIILCLTFWGTAKLFPIINIWIMYLHKHRERCESIHTIAVTLDLVAQTVESLLAVQETQVPSLGQEGPLEKEMAITLGLVAQTIESACNAGDPGSIPGSGRSPGEGNGNYLRPGGPDSRESACNVGDPGSIPGSGRSPGEGNGNPLQYSCLVNPMDRGAWWARVHGVPKSPTRLSN